MPAGADAAVRLKDGWESRGSSGKIVGNNKKVFVLHF
jgi:hypothetical protein